MKGLLDYLDKMVSTQRRARFETQPQLSLGELIALVEPIATEKPEIEVTYDFGYFSPQTIDSWRGAYEELALDYSDEKNALKAGAFLQMLKEAIGKIYSGYKGGDYRMTINRPVWVANYGNSGHTVVVGVVDNSYQMIIQTAFNEY